MRRLLALWIALLLSSCAAQPAAAPSRRAAAPAYTPPAQATHVIDPSQLGISHLDPQRYPITGTGGVLLGLRHGAWRFEQAGRLVASGDYLDGLRHGAWVFGKPSAPQAMGLYEQGVLHGRWRFACLSLDRLSCEAEFDRGQQLSWHVSWGLGRPSFKLSRADGQRWLRRAYDAQGRLRERVELELKAPPAAWEPHQQRTFIEQLSRFDDISKACHGLKLTYDERGRLLSEASCEHGQLHGAERVFYPDAPAGALRELNRYERGRRHGEVRRFERDGQLIAIEHYSQGLRVGHWQRFEQGKLVVEQRFIDGVLHGPSRAFFNDGKLKSERLFLKGITQGRVLELHPNGRRWAVLHYKDGALHGRMALYHPNGQRLVQGQWEQGKPVGRWRGWFTQGRLRFDGEFHDAADVQRCLKRLEAQRVACARGDRLCAGIGSEGSGLGPAHPSPSPEDKCKALLGQPKPGHRSWSSNGELLKRPLPMRGLALRAQQSCSRWRLLPADALSGLLVLGQDALHVDSPSWHQGYLLPQEAACVERLIRRAK